MVKTFIIMIFFLGLLGCSSASDQRNTSDVKAQDSEFDFGICHISVSDLDSSEKSPLIENNKEMKCKPKEKCYALSAKGICSEENPQIYFSALERNLVNYSKNAEPNIGSFKYKGSSECISGKYELKIWLQLKGIDNFEVKSYFFKDKESMEKDKSDYINVSANTFSPLFSASKSEVLGFTDRAARDSKKSLMKDQKFMGCLKAYPELVKLPKK